MSNKPEVAQETTADLAESIAPHIAYIEISLRVRPLWKRYLLLPKTWAGHYRILRRYNGRWRSAMDAARLARLLVTI